MEKGKKQSRIQKQHNTTTTMRISLAFFIFFGSASAFQSTSSPHASYAVLRMSDAAEAPLLEVKEKVPCFPNTPLLGGEYFIGENYWNLLTTEYGSEATGAFIQASEIKHGRAAMLATVGFAFHKLGLTLDHISPHKYLSVTHDIKFADLAALTPLEALKAVPAEGLIQMVRFSSSLILLQAIRVSNTGCNYSFFLSLADLNDTFIVCRHCYHRTL